MAILIENMEMPKSCDSCRIMVFEDTNCVDELYCGCPIVFEAHPQGVDLRPDYCPLIEVPEPHGRLGDLDELYASLEKWLIQNRHSMTEATRVWIRGVLEGIAAAPTIIPASKEG